jgi:hypothetical protein
MNERIFERVVAMLGYICLLALGGSIVLAILEVDIPPFVAFISAASFGALSSLLVPPGNRLGKDDSPPKALL